MRKVLLITNIPAPYTVDLLYYMQTHNEDNEFFVLYTAKGEDNREWKMDKDKLINTSFSSSKIIKIKTKLDFRYIHIPINITKCIDKIEPDIIISWEYNLAAVLSLNWCRRKKKKYISLTEGTLTSERDLWFIQICTRRYISQKADAFIVSGIKAKEKLLSWGVDERRIFTALLTVDVNPYLRIHRSGTRNIILYVGSLTERKGLDLLINALPLIQSDYIVHIVGNGSEENRKKLQKLALSNGVEKKIRWCGYKEGAELLNEYSEAKVFVLPTREDCFGLVLLEALAARVPIVSSKFADGAYDIVKDKENGYIVNPFEPMEIAQAIDNVLQGKLNIGYMELYDIKLTRKFQFSEVIQGYISAIEYVSKKSR